MIPLVQALDESSIKPPSWGSHEDSILALALIYLGMEQSPTTMPKEPGTLWAWALALVDELRDEDFSTIVTESFHYIQDVHSRQFLPEGRVHLHTALDEELIF